jgi:hypothetical protein
MLSVIILLGQLCWKRVICTALVYCHIHTEISGKRCRRRAPNLQQQVDACAVSAAVLCCAMLCCAGDCYRADHLLEAAIEAALEDTKAPLSPEAKRVSCRGSSGAEGVLSEVLASFAQQGRVLFEHELHRRTPRRLSAQRP